MKFDNYLSLCLEQAQLSPLGQRHGCIVVKGGKVIGKGFNDYRSGFDGGALKTGNLPSKSFPIDKSKDKGKIEPAFKTFEDMFSGKSQTNPNPVLSMHSEMMAINSALASSGTLAKSNQSCIKPSHTLPRDSKRKRHQRRELNKSLAATAVAAASPRTRQYTGEVSSPGWRVKAGTRPRFSGSTFPEETTTPTTTLPTTTTTTRTELSAGSQFWEV